MSKLIDFRAEYVKRHDGRRAAAESDDPLVASNDNPPQTIKMVAGRPRFISVTGDELLPTFGPEQPPSLKIERFFMNTWEEPL
jgi:hypothetical protein